MITKAIYEEGVLKPLEKLDLPEKTKVRVTVRGSFSKLIEEVGEIEAKEDIDKVLESMRTRNYYG
jgi:predicted DNA-binding antitoxin AbrB/MazE fold protein